jgi:electron transfer flavoprotein alpha subunit
MTMPNTLVVVQHDGQSVKRSSLSAVTLARQLSAPYAILVLGTGIATVVENLRQIGASLVLVADDPALAEPVADRYAAVVAQAAKSIGADTVLGTASTFTKDVLPRVAALLDAPMLSDVTAVESRDGELLFQRPLSAGGLFATIKLEAGPRVLSVRGTAFHPPEPNGDLCPVEKIEVDSTTLPKGTRFVSRERPESTRPDLTEARVIVSGGRPLKDQQTFERLIGGLADVLGGAVGATRAAVDAGMAPNQCQIGQTAKTVAPELYIAVGVSGAIQHVAGMKDSRVIVAINRDAEAPIFQVATYGLVGDLHEIVPRLTELLRSRS